jgi:exodeoxyribonuclease VIII
MHGSCQEATALRVAGVFDSGKPEQSCIAELDGLLCKARPDHLNLDAGIHLQYKTGAGTAEPEAWIRSQLFASGHDMAGAFYERVIAAATGKTVRTVFLVQSQAAPHACSLVALSPMAQDLAERKVTRALNLWAACQKANRWPSFPGRIAYAEPPMWEVAKEEEREAGDPLEFLNNDMVPA